jgi:hypothetical protein
MSTVFSQRSSHRRDTIGVYRSFVFSDHVCGFFHETEIGSLVLLLITSRSKDEISSVNLISICN